MYNITCFRINANQITLSDHSILPDDQNLKDTGDKCQECGDRQTHRSWRCKSVQSVCQQICSSLFLSTLSKHCNMLPCVMSVCASAICILLQNLLAGHDGTHCSTNTCVVVIAGILLALLLHIKSNLKLFLEPRKSSSQIKENIGNSRLVLQMINLITHIFENLIMDI